MGDLAPSLGGLLANFFTQKSPLMATMENRSPAPRPPLLGATDRFVANAAHGLATLPQRAFDASAQMRETGIYDPAPFVETALTGMTGGMPMAVKGAAGIFGGRLAKTADHTALARAEKMATEGKYPDEIWTQTGWFKGADDKWKFEIPDTASKITGPMDATVGQSFHHPELYAAYPQMRDVTLTSSPGRQGGAYQVGDAMSGSSPNIDIGGLANQRSVLLHELQHGVQGIEGFAAGGNNVGLQANTPAWGIYQERLKAMKTPLDRETYGKAAGYPDGVVPEKDYKAYLKIINKPSPAADRSAQQYAADSYYQRLAGEVEARNVQKRADMSPQELRDLPPDFTQDIARDRQFVRFRNER